MLASSHWGKPIREDVCIGGPPFIMLTHAGESEASIWQAYGVHASAVGISPSAADRARAASVQCCNRESITYFTFTVKDLKDHGRGGRRTGPAYTTIRYPGYPVSTHCIRSYGYMYVDRAAAGRVPRRSTRGLFRLCGAAVPTGSPILPRLMPVHILFYFAGPATHNAVSRAMLGLHDIRPPSQDEQNLLR